MTDFEPYVADPVEAPPAPRWERARAAVAVIAILLLVAALSYLAFGGRTAQDPAMGAVGVEHADV